MPKTVLKVLGMRWKIQFRPFRLGANPVVKEVIQLTVQRDNYQLQLLQCGKAQGCRTSGLAETAH